jgi:hypothetical protein
MRNKLILASAALLLPLAACTREAAAPKAGAPESPFRLTATIQEIMDAEVDPAADFLWASVGFVATTKGAEDKQPRTDKEWETVRNNVIILIEATNLLAMPGRQVATAGSRLDPSEVAGIDDPKDIQKAIDSNFAAFVGYAHGLHDAGMAMLAAIDKKDVDAMGPAGEKLDAACEACHRAYWYPNAPEPIQTFEGKTVGVGVR